MRHNATLDAIKRASLSDRIDWHELDTTLLSGVFSDMRKTMQNPEYHGEGDVFTHTRLVCEALVCLDGYKNASENDKLILFLAALLHDIGKPSCTQIKDGAIASPYHAKRGATIARAFLWRELGLCGDAQSQEVREAVSFLVRYHSFPPYAMGAKNAERRLFEISSNGELTSDFTVEKLCFIEKADVLGRICKDTDEQLQKIEYCEDLAKEIGCFDAPYAFASPFSQRGYFARKTSWQGDELYKSTWGEVILMAGLPGTGKDTYIKANFPDLPMISLDEIRTRLKISPTENQSAVIAEAHANARELLRKKQPFVWNATSLTADLRAKQISLFEGYGASVKTLFLETEWNEELRRNAERSKVVPEEAIERMLLKLEMPERFESETVIWKNV